MKNILLVDGSHLARRNYHGQSLSTTSGQKTGLIFGFINSLISAQSSVEADKVIVVWDGADGNRWRREIFPMYKSGRSVLEEDYVQQLKRLKELLYAMGVATVQKDGEEADDVAGYLAKRALVEDKVYILTGDKDYLQLIDDRVSIINPVSGLVIPVNGRVPVKEASKTVWIRPEQIIDFKCLVGDASDTIPGAPGFGVGAAEKFFLLNNGIDDILNGTAKLQPLAAKAVAGVQMVKPLLEKFRLLVTINIDRGEVDTSEIVAPTPNPPVVSALFELYEFNQFKARGEHIYKIRGNTP